MRKPFMLLILAFIATAACAERLHISTPNLSMVIDATIGGSPEYVYFGPRLSETDLAVLPEADGGRMDIYPAFGLNPANEAAISCRHADGDITTVLQVTSFDQSNGLTVIHIKDPRHAQL